MCISARLCIDGLFSTDSDIDIGLILAHKTKIRLMDIIRHHFAPIEDATGHQPHFSILSTSNIVFAKEVLSTGELLICNDSYACKTFRMYVYSMYANLNLERIAILEHYSA